MTKERLHCVAPEFSGFIYETFEKNFESIPKETWTKVTSYIKNNLSNCQTQRNSTIGGSIVNRTSGRNAKNFRNFHEAS